MAANDFNETIRKDTKTRDIKNISMRVKLWPHTTRGQHRRDEPVKKLKYHGCVA